MLIITLRSWSGSTITSKIGLTEQSPQLGPPALLEEVYLVDLAHLKITTTTIDPALTGLTTTAATREVEYLECPGAELRIQ